MSTFFVAFNFKGNEKALHIRYAFGCQLFGFYIATKLGCLKSQQTNNKQNKKIVDKK